MTLPRSMRVIEVLSPGPDSRLEWRTRPVPSCGPDELLIEVRAAGLNHADLAQRAGRYPLKPGVSDILGLEVAGVVAQVGARVSSFRPGDRVCALLAGGGYAEYVAAPCVQCLPMPANLAFAEAAALPEAFATVWLNVFQKAGLKSGETLLVHGGSSGVGISAIQIASSLGARVICTAGGDAKRAACVEAGATLAIDYLTQDFESEIKAVPSGRVDVVFDMIGGSYFPKNMHVLAHGGRMVYIASLGGRNVELDLVELMRKRITLFGSVLRPLAAASKGNILQDMRNSVWPLIERGAIVPKVFARFPFGEAERAHELMKSRRHIGKLVLEMT